MKNLNNLRSTFEEQKKIRIAVSSRINNGSKIALKAVNNTIREMKELLAHVGLIPKNQSSGISVEYTMTSLYTTRITFTFYRPCDLNAIERHSERIRQALADAFKGHITEQQLILAMNENSKETFRKLESFVKLFKPSEIN